MLGLAPASAVERVRQLVRSCAGFPHRADERSPRTGRSVTPAQAAQAGRRLRVRIWRVSGLPDFASGKPIFGLILPSVQVAAVLVRTGGSSAPRQGKEAAAMERTASKRTDLPLIEVLADLLTEDDR